MIAAVLSLVPGLGHVYRGHPWKGLAWFAGVITAYGEDARLGFILHLVCAANAALRGRTREERFTRVAARSRAWSGQ